MKTVRFTKIVEEVGLPEPYTLWLPPEKDREFQAAIKGHRVMTVHQENTGTASDFGEIGFVKNVQGSILVFPKSLQRYEGRRVVGVKYDLLKETPAGAPTAKPKKSAKRETQPEPERRPSKRQSKPMPVQESPTAAPQFQPLRVFEPEQAKEPPEPKEEEDQGRRVKALTRDVRKAMKKLEQGNAVAAYQILEKSVS